MLIRNGQACCKGAREPVDNLIPDGPVEACPSAVVPVTALARPPGDDYLIADPLFLKNGSLHLTLCGNDLPLLMGDRPVREFLPGWRAAALFTGFAPLFLLELVHDSGARATWFHDYRLERISDAVAALPRELVDLLKSRAVPLLRLLTDALLVSCDPVVDPRVRAFLGVNEATRLAIGVLCVDELVRMPALHLADDLVPGALVYRGEDGRTRLIDHEWISEALSEDWQDRIAGFVRAGRMSWPSPVDGVELYAQGGLVFDDFHFAFRFVDHRHKLVFFIMVGEHLSAVGGIWFPSMGLMVSHDETQHRLARVLIPSMPSWFVTHPLLWADTLFAYLNRGATRFASVMRGPPGVHIGHQLWNEVSGIDRYVQDAPDALFEWIVLNSGEGIELYGPLDRLFPELAGKVNRSLHTAADLARYAYEQGVLVLRVTREHVSRRLRQRIQLHVAQLPAARRVMETLPASRDAPVILFGLRVENRTIIDLGDFLAHFVAFVADRYPGAVIVFDGHNASSEEADGRVIGSHGEGFAGRSPVSVEHELVAGLRTAFAERPVTIIDTIGAPISASIAWATASDCFVSIWGASLAKYRWVCNAPGYVLTGQANLLRRGDLHIYDDPAYMQDPSPLIFPDPELITDDPDAVQLVPVAPGAWALFNFHVDRARLLPEIGAFIERSMQVRADRA